MGEFFQPSACPPVRKPYVHRGRLPWLAQEDRKIKTLNAAVTVREYTDFINAIRPRMVGEAVREFILETIAHWKKEELPRQ
jgi:hypothetical protein